MICWLVFDKKPFQFWREIWIHVVVILLQLYIEYTVGSHRNKSQSRLLQEFLIDSLGIQNHFGMLSEFRCRLLQ